MGELADHAVVVDGGAGVDDHPVPNPAPGVHGGLSEDHDAAPEQDVAADGGARMDGAGEPVTRIESASGQALAICGVADRDDDLGVRLILQHR